MSDRTKVGNQNIQLGAVDTEHPHSAGWSDSLRCTDGSSSMPTRAHMRVSAAHHQNGTLSIRARVHKN